MGGAVLSPAPMANHYHAAVKGVANEDQTSFEGDHRQGSRVAATMPTLIFSDYKLIDV